MHTNMNFPAPVAVMGLLTAIGGLLLSALVMLYAGLRRKPRVAKWMAAVAGIGAVIYLGLLFGFSMASRDTVLRAGEEKYFCEIDCHLAYSVVGVSQEKQISTEQGMRTGAGVFYVLKVKTRFDEKTIAPWRGNAPLSPSPRELKLVDDQGHEYRPVAQTGSGLAAAPGEAPLRAALRPGESYTTELVFEVPADIHGSRLLLELVGGVARPVPDRGGEQPSSREDLVCAVIPGNAPGRCSGKPGRDGRRTNPRA